MNQNPFAIVKILDGLLRKEDSAQREFYKLHYGFAKSIALRYSSNKDDAEEITNDGFMKVFNNIHKYEREKPIKAWIRTILVNTALDHYRKKNKIIFDSVDQVPDVNHEEANALDTMEAEDILKMVQELPVSYRTVFMMYVVDGYSYKEIAETLQIQEVTCRTNFLQARKKLQAMIYNNYQKTFWTYNKRSKNGE